jgi:hypothetical protein
MIGTNFRKYFWALGNYDFFFQDYCREIHSSIFSIGVFFLFQLLIVFNSVLTACVVFFPNGIVVDFLLAVVLAFLFYKWLEFVNKIQHNHPGIDVLIVQYFINFVCSVILSVPFGIALFEKQILLKVYLESGKSSIGKFEQLWILPLNLFESCVSDNNGGVILFICTAILAMTTFVFVIPYSMIYQNRNSNYSLVKKRYEQNFNEEI